MKSITLNIQIGGRVYPTKVQENQEEYVRLASKQINEQLKKYAAQFPSTDTQDRLSLTALDILSRQLVEQAQRNASEQQSLVQLSEIEELISSN